MQSKTIPFDYLCLFLCLHFSRRFSCAPNCHQCVPTEASGKWLVQSASCEAEAENNWDCPALPQQAAGAWVLHLALPRGGGGKASPLTPPLCPNTGSQAHTATHTYTLFLYSYTIYNCACKHTYTHTQNLYIYTVLFCYLYQHCLPLTLRAKCQKSMPRWKKLHFYVKGAHWRFEWPRFNSDCLWSSRFMLCGKRGVSACH